MRVWIEPPLTPITTFLAMGCVPDAFAKPMTVNVENLLAGSFHVAALYERLWVYFARQGKFAFRDSALAGS